VVPFERRETLGEDADRMLTAAWVGTKRGVNATGSISVSTVVFVGKCVVDEGREDVEPEGAIEGTLGEQGAVRASEDVAVEMGGAESVTLVAQVLESDVTGLPFAGEVAPLPSAHLHVVRGHCP
jgi:hypothetical protein